MSTTQLPPQRRIGDFLLNVVIQPRVLSRTYRGNMRHMLAGYVVPATLGLYLAAHYLIWPRFLEWLGRYSGWWPTKSDSVTIPAFARDPPPLWEAVWTSGNTTLYRVR